MCAGFAPFSIRHLLQFDLLEQLPKLQVVSAAASKEAALAKALSKMQADWQGVEFRVVEYKDTGTYVVGGTDEVQVRLLGSLIRYMSTAFVNAASRLSLVPTGSGPTSF
jgi:dynein heavy chain